MFADIGHFTAFSVKVRKHCCRDVKSWKTSKIQAIDSANLDQICKMCSI
uniref:Uncharacterized protein n=1 Tax=Chenopodium quinoa TaxID=63459 RepID=A0A803LSX6_CHEQI